jgi:hypothetical protein
MVHATTDSRYVYQVLANSTPPLTSDRHWLPTDIASGSSYDYASLTEASSFTPRLEMQVEVKLVVA